MKILHCADVHLDSRMESRLSKKLANMRRAEIRETFCRLIRYAGASGARAVLIAGDLFDEARCTRTTVEQVLDAMAQLPETDFLYLRGNHDTIDLFADIAVPSNFKTFGETWRTYRYEGVAITGVELTSRNYRTVYGALALDAGLTNVVMMHGVPATRAGLLDVDLRQLAGKGIDYLALGHIHQRSGGRIDRRGAWACPGCLEGRGFDELGKKGFLELDIDAGSVSAAFVPFAKRTHERVMVDLEGLVTAPEIIAAAREELEGISADSLVEIVLAGNYSASTNKDAEAVREAFDGEFFSVCVKDDSVLALDPADYRDDVSLRGEFVRTVLARSDLDGERRSRVLAVGLAALAGEEIGL